MMLLIILASCSIGFLLGIAYVYTKDSNKEEK